METQRDTLKVVYKHQQHARVQKEGEETWISSEDLRTEGSSEEDFDPGASSRGRRMKKNRKQRKTTLLDTSKNTASRALSSSAYSIGATAQKISSQTEKPAIETNIDMISERFSMMDNNFFTDVFPDSPAGTSGISLSSTDSGMDALNLESRWRPKRGSLKYPILVEGTSVEV